MNADLMVVAPASHRVSVAPSSPDYSHAGIATTGNVSAAAGMVGNNVWLTIALVLSTQSSSRYVHVGHMSDGCVSVYEIGQWTAIYDYLISHRVPGSAGKRVGTLMVKK